MKYILFGLLLIWLAFTIKVSKEYADYKDSEKGFKEYLVYSRFLRGCMKGSEFQDNNYNFEETYYFCVKSSYEAKDEYIKRMKGKE
jgi:hypothetical protein